MKLFTRQTKGFRAEKAMESQFRSNCHMCHGEITEGDPIFYSRKNGARHQNCVEQTGRTLAQIVVDFINNNPHMRDAGSEMVYVTALNSTLLRFGAKHLDAIDREKTKDLPGAWAVFVDGSALRPIEGDPEGRFETFTPDQEANQSS